MRLLFILLCSFASASAACAGGDPLARLRALSAAAQCRQSADCRTVPVGVRACGGPASYLAVAKSDEVAAQALAQRHAEQRRQQMARSPEPPSTCEVIRDPGAQCVAGRCVAGNSALPAE
ncbi:hypothetical protein GCM10027277_48020 [Pseudoduganella ginsengisoli]|uniref:DUF4189 domain-containing protein n=1 Tax=Pseudoduganella ginsengisoli TaxID=1462440 RepID=A0A6L6Q3J0_9BURK|nr:hypothetical protein [Pseudoduganella ginsengisoli]MTW04009.1 hypothetical protein [Pseudoduganella ginsengisoli]